MKILAFAVNEEVLEIIESGDSEWNLKLFMTSNEHLSVKVKSWIIFEEF